MTSISHNVYIDQLDDIVNGYNNTYSTIKMKPVDVISSTYSECNKENNKDPKIEVGDHVRKWKRQTNFAKCHTPN